ncbi:hypothetical protein [Thalassotalea profundi]|uniref:Lipoprotein n=1 Tax=Thalassotalea profundi TaxID=2036687 RepID=A0ABQ3IH53_9GAMM|nr:hypothetical protein [Thalassotalea profundi]GHE83556.1 hypothetical protein GCM10011501_10140 [Thalassotalea profundi]
MFLNGVNMKYRIFILSVFLAGCASTESQVKIDNIEPTNTNLVEFAAEHKSNLINLACSPKNEEAGKSVLWVTKCNELAFNYLKSQLNSGVAFQRPISKNPFGMAADFTAKILMSNPSNFKAVSLGQTFKFSINKI